MGGLLLLRNSRQLGLSLQQLGCASFLLENGPKYRSKRGQSAPKLDGMASPVVPRRSARLTARSAASSSVLNANALPEREVILKKRRNGSEHLIKKAITVLPKHGPKSPKPGKISAYFSKIVVAGKKKKKMKGKKARKETIREERITCSEMKSKSLEMEDVSFINPLTSCDETKLPAKHERLLKKGPSRDLEAELWEMGFQHVAGVDEAGRGPLAGPVVAAACIIPSHITFDGINDSKKLTEERREEMYLKLTTTPGISYAVHVIDPRTIDEVNILQATMQAMSACVEKLNSLENGLPCPDFILVDGNRLPSDMPETKARSVVKGDAVSYVIAAASILAKVTRDRLMISYDVKWPMYGFKSHKGYGTAAHVAAIHKHGPCDIHRLSFAPLKGRFLSTGGT